MKASNSHPAKATATDYPPCHDHVDDASHMNHNPNFLCPIPRPIPHTPITAISTLTSTSHGLDGKTTARENNDDDRHDDCTRLLTQKDTVPPTCTLGNAVHKCGTLRHYCSASPSQSWLFDQTIAESIAKANPSPNGWMKRKDGRMEWGKGIKLNSLRRGKAMKPKSNFLNVTNSCSLSQSSKVSDGAPWTGAKQNPSKNSKDKREAQIGPESKVELDQRARQMKAARAEDTKKEQKNTGGKLVVKNTFLMLDYDEHIPKTGLRRGASCPPRLFGGRCSTRKKRKQLYSEIPLTEEILAFESSLGISAHQTLGSHCAKILSSEDAALQQFEMSIGINRFANAPVVPHSAPDLPPMSAPGLKRNGVKNPIDKRKNWSSPMNLQRKQQGFGDTKKQQGFGDTNMKDCSNQSVPTTNARA